MLLLKGESLNSGEDNQALPGKIKFNVFKVDKYNEIIRIMMGSKVNGRVLYSVAGYLIDGLLIDSGWHNTRRKLVNYLATQNIYCVVNTHHHVDHIGGNKLIMEELKVNVFAPKESLPIIANRQNIFSYQEELWGCPEPCRVKVLGNTVDTGHCSFQVVQTSGHSRDHVVFFLRERGWLFTGDEFITENPNSARKNEDNKQILKALKKMLVLEPELLITSAGTIYQNGSAVLRRTIAYFEETKERVHTMKKSGLTSHEIVLELFGEEAPLKEFTGGQFSRQNFIEGFFINNGN